MSIAEIEAQIAKLTKKLTLLKLQAKTKRPILCLFDLETTGLGKTQHIKICEIGMVQYDNLKPWQSYSNPVQSVSKTVSSIHGLKNEFLQQQPSWKEVGQLWHKEINSIRDGDVSIPVILGGFNSKRYDSRIVTFENHRHGLFFPTNVFFVDFREVFPSFFPDIVGKKSLGAYHEHVLDKPIPSAHTAVADAMAIGNILKTVDQPRLFKCIEAKMEAAEAVIKRCFK